MALMLATASSATQTIEAGGLTGWIIDVVRTIGEIGVSLLVLLEVVVPPIPSEVVLPFSGALVAGGRFTFLGVFVAATIGSVLGAWALYEAANRLGHDRVARGLARIPLVRRDDVDRGDGWFRRHGRIAVLTGRMVPGVRSLVSIPAGAQEMSRPLFLTLTAVGSGLWNGLLIGGGVLLGRQWQTVEDYTRWLDVAMVVAVGLGLAKLVQRRLRDA